MQLATTLNEKVGVVGMTGTLARYFDTSLNPVMPYFLKMVKVKLVYFQLYRLVLGLSLQPFPPMSSGRRGPARCCPVAP